MEGIYQHYIIDVSSDNNFVQIPTMQGDGDEVRGAEIELISNDLPYMFDVDNTIVSISGTKPDTTHIFNECSVSENGYILVDITSQMSLVYGRGEYAILLINKTTGSQLQSFPFYILATPTPHDAPDIVSSNEFLLLTQRIAESEDVINKGNEEILEMQELNASVTANENERISAEEIREENESTRIANEEGRVEAEEIRQESFDTMMESANAQIERLEQTNETASASAKLAEEYTNIATEQANIATTSAENASLSEQNAKASEEVSIEQASIATECATNTALSEENAKASEEIATTMADLAKSYAVGTDNTIRENDSVSNAKYYCELAEKYATTITWVAFKGSITFAELSLEKNQKTNYMFNITDDFETDDTFNCGAGIKYSRGTNVCRTEDGYWDVLCGIDGLGGTNEIVTASIDDEPTDQDVGEYWSFEY